MTSLEHSILLANLGTSDLAIKDSKYGYFIPLSFNSEPNLIRPTAGSDEYQAWQERDSRLQEIYGELEIHQERPAFRLVTEKLSEKLKQTEDFTKWYPRIIPVRLLGFISQALENRKFKNIHTIYLFTTNQGSPGHISDTVYVFDIIEIWLERWLQDKNYKHINIRKIEVNFSAINLDLLFDFYYKKIDGLISDDQKEITALIVSNKGGTNQMQEAMRMQTSASSFPFVFYLEPVLNVVSILKGQPASCSLKIFWRRERSLNYQTANLLLSQWNYAGALKILEQWSSKLSMLCEYKLDASDIEELNKSQSNLSKILEALRIADFCFNLDMKQVQSRTIQWQNKFGELPPELTKLTKPINSENYNIILNLYTQCKIFWEIDQIANFLARMQSFYEAVLKQLLSSLEMDSYIDIDKNTGNWNPNDQKITNQDLTRYITKFRNDQKKNGHPVRNLSSRSSQKILIKCFISSFSREDQRLTNEILKCLDELDYWCVQRNNLIHRAKGISKATMQELDEEKRTFNKNSCESDKICSVMANICKNPLCAIPQELRDNYVEPSLDFYLYSNARSWIQELLREEAKKI